MDVKHQTQPTGKTGGPTSLAMVMTYFGTETTGQEVCSWLGNCNRDTGSDFSELLDAAKHYGFSEAVWKYGVSELQSSIANGVPVVAIINIEAGSYPMLADGGAAYNSFSGGAYIEIHGIHCDSDGNIDYYIVNDPSQDGWADRKYTYSSMKTAWGNRDYRYLSVKEKGEAPGSTDSSAAPTPTPTPDSSSTPTPEPEPAPTPSDDKNTVKLNVAHLAQPTKTSGGPTSLAMIMNYHGTSLTGKDVCTYIGNCDDTSGTDFNQMIDAANHYGFKDASKQSGTSYFKKAIDDNVPVVAIINVETNSYPKLTNGSFLNGVSGGHYIEIHGYHLDSNKKIDYYIVNDPFQKGWKDLQLTADSMDSAWGERDYEFVVVKKFEGQAGDGAVPDPSQCTKKMEVAHQAQPTSYSCGPTSLAMAMNYYGYSYTGSQICNWIGNCYRSSGTDFGEMSSAAYHYGFTSASWEAGISTYKAAIAKGVTTVGIIAVVAGSYPMKTDGEPAFYSFTGGHYIEMHGYHCTSSGDIDYYYCNDPAQEGWKDRQYTYSSMRSAWGNRDYQFLALKSF